MGRVAVNRAGLLETRGLSIGLPSFDFPFKEEAGWRHDIPDQHPCLLYRVLYVFDFDPLTLVTINQSGNLYYMTENRDFINSVHFYYLLDDRQDLLLSELRELNIDID